MEFTGKSYSIQPISGNLDFGQARHLLDRCLFGVKKEEADALVGKSILSALDKLTAIPAAPEPPVITDEEDQIAEIGSTWVNEVYNGTYNTYRLKSLRSWWIGNMMLQGTSLVEKMVLFWHNHFVTESGAVTVASLLYQYNQLLRNFALGNIRQLACEITISPAMLVYLNGESNKAGAPNENYGRELFELFTIGKGPQIGNGDYSNYTETDIREAAKVLTGWKVDRTIGKSYYDRTRHDTTTKNFTNAFDRTSIQNKEADEYRILIEMIFKKKETARFLARKIYRWFMHHEINQTIENQIIEPLATTLFNNNFEIKPMLVQLLSSEHFFSTDYRGSLIKNPLDFTIGVYRKCGITLSDSLLNNYEIWNAIYFSCRDMEMTLGDPPDVAGWPQYYKEPAYSQLWINSSTIPYRATYTDTLSSFGFTKGRFKYVIDPFILSGYVDDPTDVTSVINGLARILLPCSLNDAQVLQFKEILIPGLPDSTWTFEWIKYSSNPNDANQKRLIANKLLALTTAILRMPEFYLC